MGSKAPKESKAPEKCDCGNRIGRHNRLTRMHLNGH